MTGQSYNLFCPTALAAEIIEPRWTLLILCEMWSGSVRFNEIHAGVPGISPSLLSKRLRELQARGLVERHGSGQGAGYVTTDLADGLRPIVEALGEWAHTNLDPAVALERLDDRALMWNVRRKIDPSALPRRRATVEFRLRRPDGGEGRYWLLIRPNAETDLCMVDPKRDVDLFVVAELRAFTSAWMGHSTFAAEIETGRIELLGDGAMARSLSKWMIRSRFAGDLRQPARQAAE